MELTVRTNIAVLPRAFRTIFFALMMTWACVGTVRSADPPVRLIAQTPRSFELLTGEYRIRYDVAPSQPAWICILREGTHDGIATKLACGQHLDVTDGGTGEGKIYNWKELRKDSDMFRSPDLRRSGRCDSRAPPDGAAMGEVRLPVDRVEAVSRPRTLDGNRHGQEDKAFSGEVEPDCFFITGTKTRRGGVTRSRRTWCVTASSADPVPRTCSFAACP